MLLINIWDYLYHIEIFVRYLVYSNFHCMLLYIEARLSEHTKNDKTSGFCIVLLVRSKPNDEFFSLNFACDSIRVFPLASFWR